jgi:16S rRNA (uracil1498-N3)-methyltransferase
MKHIPRLYVNAELQKEIDVFINDAQLHHVANVLRFKEGDIIRIFNETFGEWNCEIVDLKKQRVKCLSLFKEPETDDEIGPVLAISLINQNRMSILLEKVTELGVSEIVTVISKYTQYRTFNKEKYKRIIKGACEQSARTSIPKLTDPVKLSDFLENYNFDCKLVVADEYTSVKKSQSLFSKKCVLLVGPEGGFSDEERFLFDQYPFIEKISLGNNILRSETAAIALVSIWKFQ